MTDAYYIKREDTFVGKKLKFGETAANKFVRLAKRESGAWSRPVHETWEIDGNVNELTAPLTHQSTVSIAEFVKKIDTYSTSNAEYLYKQGVRASWWQIMVYPLAKFFKDYIILQGFRDGTHGFVHAMMMSMHSFLTRAKLYFYEAS